ncbi:metallophosphoesterase [Streptomyces sp. RFCAC02]|uniref:metallophosphoesterase n=1 Tax=Streptomyces sp. RFCAC02 TaxID=2499143 RepID=UPI0010205BAC|nr:metallophosphoesterase [Streptomyces sp. RFCAC02]
MTDSVTPDHLIVHFSDTHFTGGDKPLHGVADTRANLTAALQAVEAAGITPDALVFTGDLADTADADAYDRLRRTVEPAAERIGAPVVWVMGNHDERGAFRAGLLDADPTDEPYDTVHRFGGLRLIALDSTVPGEHYGEIVQEQLDWLADELATPAEGGTILALHHPPLAPTSDLLRLVDLRERERLAEVVAGSDVRMILGGHYHYASSGLFAGVPVAVAAATCYSTDILSPASSAHRGMDAGQSFNLVHCFGGDTVASTTPWGDAQTLYEVTTEQMATWLAAGDRGADAVAGS